MYIQPYSQAKLEGKAEASLPVLKTDKSVLVLERNALIVSNFGLNFPFKM